MNFAKKTNGFVPIREVSRLIQAFGMISKKKLDVVIESPLVARYEFKKTKSS